MYGGVNVCGNIYPTFKCQKPVARDEFQFLIKLRQSITVVALSEDDLKGFSSSKDGTILH